MTFHFPKILYSHRGSPAGGSHIGSYFFCSSAIWIQQRYVVESRWHAFWSKFHCHWFVVQTNPAVCVTAGFVWNQVICWFGQIKCNFDFQWGPPACGNPAFYLLTMLAKWKMANTDRLCNRMSITLLFWKAIMRWVMRCFLTAGSRWN